MTTDIIRHSMDTIQLIRRKRDGGRLRPEEVWKLVEAYAGGAVPEYQMAAWLMAVFCRGLSPRETLALTRAIIRSGRPADLSGIPGPRVDKHSTGGVGDKVSLILAPLIASCGAVVPMVSGRSLGHTGGTLDKLESIPGFRTALGRRRFREVLAATGCAMSGQSAALCPADRKLYALRDVTATVESIPLISASIMSKKLAEGIDALVLDVKTGTGAFMARPSEARRLARSMIRIGDGFGTPVVAFVTGMWEPLGTAVGNSVEVVEALEALKGKWRPDLEEVTLALGEEMLVLVGLAGSRTRARRRLVRAIESGAALDVFRRIVIAQGGDARVVDDYRRLPAAKHTREVRAPSSGYVAGIDALVVGRLGIDLGIGRRRLGDRVDHAAGFRFRKKVGDRVEKGELLAEVLSSNRQRGEGVATGLARCIRVSRSAHRVRGLVVDRLTGRR